jgi:hypothetical protein
LFTTEAFPCYWVCGLEQVVHDVVSCFSSFTFGCDALAQNSLGVLEEPFVVGGHVAADDGKAEDATGEDTPGDGFER